MRMGGGREFLVLAFGARRAPRRGAEKGPGRGGESIMKASFKRPAASDLYALLALVAGSPIRSRPAPSAEAVFADWEKERKSADVDALILAWIASYVQGLGHRGRLH